MILPIKRTCIRVESSELLLLLFDCCFRDSTSFSKSADGSYVTRLYAIGQKKQNMAKEETQAVTASIPTCTFALHLLHASHLLLSKFDEVIFGQRVKLRIQYKAVRDMRIK